MPDIAWTAQPATRILSLFLGCSFATAAAAASDRFAIEDGSVMHYVGAAPTRLDVGYKCTDLWVAPDGSAVAFVAIEKTKKADDKGLGYEQEPLIERSSVYIARKAGGFVPTLAFAKPILIDGRAWHVFRCPSLSPDGRYLYFGVPFTMTTWKIVDVSLADNSYKTVGNATDYCVMWGGARSGDLLVQRRYLPEDPTQGVSYRCYLLKRSGTGENGTDSTEISDRCDPFERFVSRWAVSVGGVCKIPEPQ